MLYIEPSPFSCGLGLIFARTLRTKTCAEFECGAAAHPTAGNSAPINGRAAVVIENVYVYPDTTERGIT